MLLNGPGNPDRLRVARRLGSDDLFRDGFAGRGVLRGWVGNKRYGVSIEARLHWHIRFDAGQEFCVNRGLDGGR